MPCPLAIQRPTEDSAPSSPPQGSIAGRRSFFQDGGFLTFSFEDVKFPYHISKTDQRRENYSSRKREDRPVALSPSFLPIPTPDNFDTRVLCYTQLEVLCPCLTAREPAHCPQMLSLSFPFQLRKTEGPSLISRVPCWRHFLFTWESDSQF